MPKGKIKTIERIGHGVNGCIEGDRARCQGYIIVDGFRDYYKLPVPIQR